MTKRFCSVQQVILWSIVVSSCITDAINLSPAWAEQLETTQTHQRKYPATTVDEWMTQIAQAIAQINRVEVKATATGLEIVLQTAAGEITVPTTTIVGNDAIADIPNAVLALPEGDQFQQINPSEGIALVSVSNLPDNRVRVVITGIDAAPKAAIATESQSLIISITPEAEEDAIEIVITGEQEEGYNLSSAATATRTDTPLRDVPASIQVIPQQVIEDQGRLRLSDAVRNNAPGVTTSNSYAGTGQGEFIIRGFRQNYNFRNGFRDGKFGFIADFANIEQIEVLRGPASVLFGQVQPGGIVNIVTNLIKLLQL